MAHRLCCLSNNKACDERSTQYFALLVALIFAIHPLQSQAVTYIVQRTASLVALFYLLALYFFVLARMATVSKHRFIWLMCCLTASLCAFVTKQNSATLPVAIALVELIFFSSTWVRNRKFLWGFIGLCISVIFLGLIRPEQSLALIDSIDAATRETPNISRLEYLDTQLHVVAGYLYTFFWPQHLQLEYDVSLQAGDFSSSYGYLILHLSLILFALSMMKRQPLVAFGILFYYLSQMVESSVVPIRDVVFEHRTYLPNFGLILAGGGGIYWLMRLLYARWPSNIKWINSTVGLIFGILCVALTILTVQRNQLWQDPIRFYQNELKYSANKPRVHNALGQSYMAEEEWGLAADSFREAFFLEFESGIYGFEARYLSNYVAALKNGGETEKAIQTTLEFLDVAKDRKSRSLLMTNLGYMFIQLRDGQRAYTAFEEALKVGRNQAPLEANLGMGLSLWALKRPSDAKVFFQRVLVMDPTHSYARQLLKQLASLGY
ncbi:tetratricopeptide repeat protein [Vibrio rotiferianus]|uniref:tetratricopeptide repeat protein n=1 Tax=Vibrio rotiferianus TaxID=190895 RepID=UPI003918DD86